MKIFTFLTLILPFLIFSQGNPAITEANIDDVCTQFNLTGDGVIFASMERGIDYTHPAYLNPDGTTRIAYLYDMINPAGATNPNNPYNIGTIFTEADINTALQAGGIPLSTDRFGHGTACIGITAGNGGGTASMEFQGVAPKAKLIVVKMVHDPFPAFGSEPGQSSFFNATYIPVALQFIHDKVTELGLPSVTLMNFGSIGGPTDGTSTISRAMGDFIAQGHVLVCGVGDDGGSDNHASGTILQGQTQEIIINKGTAGNLRFDLWYSEDDRFDITIEVPGGTQFGPYAAPFGPTYAVDQFKAAFNMYHRGSSLEFFGATSNRRELLIDFFGSNGTYKVIVNGASITDSGNFNASLNPSTYYNNNAFISHVVSGYSINDYTSAFNVITPGDYVVDNTWTDINGIPRSRVGEGNPNEIWAGSSSGPTYDGRQGIDFVASGEVIFAPYSPNTYYSNFAFNMVQNGNNLYGIQNAVSAAAPLACGVIALMLELDPTLTNQKIKDILKQTARQDSFTGTVPNNTWGNGKMDALAAAQEVNNLLSLEHNSLKNIINIYPNPSRDELYINSKNTIEKATILSIDGKIIKSISNNTNTLDVSFLNPGMYFLNIKSNNTIKTLKFIKN
jgi:minor extracellular serine protease Vpr